MKFPAVTRLNGLPAYCGCVLAVALGLTAQTASAEPARPLDTRPVLVRWAQAVAGKLTQIDLTAPPVAPPVGGRTTIKTGATGDRVNRLAAQLKARGFLAADGYHGVYDSAMETAVEAFQQSVGVLADGVAGESTIEALDRTPASAVVALKTTLDGMQKLAAEAPSEFFLVNIPSQTAYLIRGSTVAMSMRAAVGRPSRPTPLLTDRVTDVVINPTWTAPTTVLAQDKLPSLRKTGHPGISNATIWLDHVEVDPATVDWTAVTPDRIRIMQSPGDNNALGRFKFNLTNGQSIYMHDTNDHSVFLRQGRALSSGCVRLAEPRQLADTLLGREGWNGDRIERALDSGRTQFVTIHHPLPVYIVYWQAIVDDGSAVRINKDIYDLNARLLSSAPRLMQTVKIAQPKQLFVSQSAAPPSVAAPAPKAREVGFFEGLLSSLMDYMPSSSAPQQVASSDASGRQDQVGHAQCSEGCGWGLY